jgi:hypothetical protein
MKNFVFRMVLVSLVTFLLSCATPQRTIPSLPRDALPGPNESEVLIQYTSTIINKAKGLLNIFIDGEMVAQVMAETSERIIVKNGPHTISVIQAGKQNLNFSAKFDGNSERITFSVLSIFSTLSLTKQGQVPLSNSNTGVEGALSRAAEDTLKNVLARSKIAIVYITAEDRSSTDYISGELEFIWVNAGYTIIDRSELDRVRKEQNFQLSGEVDDETAVSIGKFSGADIIVTGRVDGEGNLRRLRLRALNTQTAQVVGVASERL